MRRQITSTKGQAKGSWKLSSLQVNLTASDHLWSKRRNLMKKLGDVVLGLGVSLCATSHTNDGRVVRRLTQDRSGSHGRGLSKRLSRPWTSHQALSCDTQRTRNEHLVTGNLTRASLAPVNRLTTPPHAVHDTAWTWFLPTLGKHETEERK